MVGWALGLGASRLGAGGFAGGQGGRGLSGDKAVGDPVMCGGEIVTGSGLAGGC